MGERVVTVVIGSKNVYGVLGRPGRICPDISEVRAVVWMMVVGGVLLLLYE